MYSIVQRHPRTQPGRALAIQIIKHKKPHEKGCTQEEQQLKSHHIVGGYSGSGCSSAEQQTTGMAYFWKDGRLSEKKAQLSLSLSVQDVCGQDVWFATQAV